MQMENAFERVQHNFEGGLKKRFACSHCGKTWVEIVGLFAGKREGQDDVYFQLGDESEVCQNCRFRARSCPACGSKDAYEISFPADEAKDAPLSFERIRVVSKT